MESLGADWNAITISEARRLIADPHTQDGLFLALIGKVGPIDETPEFWKNIANSPNFSDLHRRRAVLQIFYRYLRVDMTLREFSEVMNGLTCIKDNDISSLSGTGTGTRPLSNVARNDFGIGVLPTHDPSGGYNLWFRFESDADRNSIINAIVKGPASLNSAEGAVKLLELRVSDGYHAQREDSWTLVRQGRIGSGEMPLSSVDWKDLSVTAARRLIGDPHTKDELLVRLLGSVGPIDETPAFWKNIANDTVFDPLHRRNAVLQLFYRYTRAGMTLRQFSEVMRGSVWLEDSKLFALSAAGTMHPLSSATTNEFVIALLQGHDASGSDRIICTTSGDVSRESFENALLKGPDYLTPTAADAIISQIRYNRTPQNAHVF